jgi:hypothetical protein
MSKKRRRLKKKRLAKLRKLVLRSALAGGEDLPPVGRPVLTVS